MRQNMLLNGILKQEDCQYKLVYLFNLKNYELWKNAMSVFMIITKTK
jgi:hypothetical protein